MKYKDWLVEWLNTYVNLTAKAKTMARYSEIVSGHIVPKLGDIELNEITPLILQRFITELLSSGNLKTGKGLSANSVNGIITVLQNSLKTACAVGLLDTYLADKITRPRVKEKQIICFTVSEQRKIEQAIFADKRSRMFGVLLCLYTGLRIGEILALKWSDIDLSSGILTVSKTCCECKSKDGKFMRITDEPKTRTSLRVIPLPKQMLSVLKEQKKKAKSEYVISGRGGEGVSVRAYQRSFELLLKKLNIPHKGFHALRHTFATRALECGVDVKTLSEILGHKNPTVTLNRYVHSLAEHKRDMMNRVGKLLSVAI